MKLLRDTARLFQRHPVLLWLPATLFMLVADRERLRDWVQQEGEKQ